jgi:hypothetical protein
MAFFRRCVVLSTLPTSAPADHVYEITCAGFAATLEAFAREPSPEPTDGHRLWLVSLVGGATTVRAIWANLLQGELANIRAGDLLLGWDHQLALGGTHWHSYQAALPSVAATHLLLLPDQARCAGDSPEFVLVPRTDDDLARLHYRYLQSRLRVPLHPAWSGWLWQRALASGEAIELEGFACRAYRCRPKPDALAADLSAAIVAGELTVADGGALPCAA